MLYLSHFSVSLHKNIIHQINQEDRKLHLDQSHFVILKVLNAIPYLVKFYRHIFETNSMLFLSFSLSFFIASVRVCIAVFTFYGSF